ncbi:MAG: hypothetical protein ACR2JO_05325 [Mycobacteriales bacterium]
MKFLVRGTMATTVAGCLLAGGATLASAGATSTSAAVTVTDAGYTPATATVQYGGKVTWSFKQGTHTVTDATRLGLYNSGSKRAGSTYAFTFINSGTFPYHSTVGTAISGKVVVPMTVTPATGTRTTYFAVRWGSDYTPTGYSEQVQIKIPGASGWSSFVYGTPASNATFRAVDWGNKTGTYQLRAKLFKGSTPGVSSGWSPIATATVH